MKTALLVGGILLIGVGAADLLLGNTNNPILPDVIANKLTQQSDLVLVGVGGLVLWFSL